jgi:hypothetical protein
MKRLVPLLVIGVSLVGCSIAAPKYNTDFNNASSLRRETLNLVRVGSVTKDAKSKNVENVTLRGGTLDSPYGSYTAYLETALKQELEDARLLDPTSRINLNAVLIKNMVDATGISVGIAEIEARFIVQNTGETLYNKVKSARHTWESAFAGNTAIPAAQQNYPIVVQKLIGSLFSDQEFIAALRQR